MKNSWDAYWDGRYKSFLEQGIERYKMEKGYGRLLSAVPEIGIKNGGCVLEVGAGKAGISRLLKARGWCTYAVDINHAIAKKMNGDIHHYVVGDMFALPFIDNSFDLVVSCGLLEHFDSIGVIAILKEMKRVGRSITAWLPSCGLHWRFLWTFRNILGSDVFTQVYVYESTDLVSMFKQTGIQELKVGSVTFAGLFRYHFIHGVCSSRGKQQSQRGR